MAVNYQDPRFTEVRNQETNALNNLNNTYNNMIENSDKYYQDQINAAKEYGNKQAEIQQANTDFTIEKLNQQKEQTRKDYIKEQKGAYADYEKQINQYGVHNEQLAAAGLRGGGYSESSRVSMYNQYQNRVTTARESYNKAILEYNNGIKEAQLTNNSKLAEISYNALKTSLELSLDGFQYKNQLLASQLNAQQSLSDTYYNRWKDVLNQINTENALAEEQRQFNEQMALSRAKVYYGGGGGGGNYIVDTNSKQSTPLSNSAISGVASGLGKALQPATSMTINGVTYTPTGNYADNGSAIYKANGKLYWYDGTKMNYGGVATSTSSNKKTTTTNTSTTTKRKESEMVTLAKNRLNYNNKK